jgi:hypothetical protein
MFLKKGENNFGMAFLARFSGFFLLFAPQIGHEISLFLGGGLFPSAFPHLGCMGLPFGFGLSGPPGFSEGRSVGVGHVLSLSRQQYR